MRNDEVAGRSRELRWILVVRLVVLRTAVVEEAVDLGPDLGS